eukprot:XP_020407941.1 uncharacterized protein LOC109945956 [Zea mays]
MSPILAPIFAPLRPETGENPTFSADASASSLSADPTASTFSAILNIRRRQWFVMLVYQMITANTLFGYSKQVDRPPNNPKRITIQSSQECFSVDIPSAEQPNPCPEVENPPNVDSQNLTNEIVQIDSDEDDFMPALKKRNVSESHTRVLRKVVTKMIKHEELPRQTLNVRCNPQDVIASINILNERQREAIRRKGFSTILDMTVDALCSRSHLQWLMDKLDPKDMTIHPGPGKELKITKDIVHLILGVPNHGGGKPLGIDEAVAASNLRAKLGVAKDEFNVTFLQDRLRKGEDDDLSIRCFFLILFNRLLFPTASWGITYHEVLLTEEMHRFHEIDWCQLIFNDLCEAAKKWHNRFTTNVSTTIYGCSIVVLLYYLDHLHTAAAPQNKTGTPRIKFFDKNSIKALTKADKRKRGEMATEEMEHNDSGPVFDPTPTPHDDTLKGTTNSGSDPPLTEQECVRSLWDLICSKDIDQSRLR